MGALLLGLGLVAGLVTYATRLDPKVPEPKQRLQFESLKKKGSVGLDKLSLNDAEDGAVLARRYGDKVWEKRFVAVVKELRKSRPKV